MEKDGKILLLAENVSIAEDLSTNPVFMQIQMRVCTNEGNKNREGVTASFISKIVNNGDVYDCVPLYCDVKNLLARNYGKLGHMFSGGKFTSTQIGSLTGFYSKTDDDGVTSLYATARVPRRESEICECLQELYADNNLSFSFEVKFNPEGAIWKNGIRFITDHPDNALCGVAVVSVPAYESAVALDLVAEAHSDTPDEIVAAQNEQDERGEVEMKDAENMNAEVMEEVVEAEAKDATETVAEVEVVSEESVAEETVVAEEEQAEVSNAEEAVAEDVEEEEPKDEDMIEECGGKDKEDAVAETQESNAEVIEESLNVYESVHECPETGETIHVTEECHRLVETIAERDQTIAELKTRIAELEEIKGKYDTIIAEREAAELATKKAQAKAFAEKQGLDITVAEVETAIDNLDYKTIVEMSIAQDQNEEESADEPVAPAVTLASFVDLEVSDENEYGGLLKPAKK